jgi:hypothetical protein
MKMRRVFVVPVAAALLLAPVACTNPFSSTSTTTSSTSIEVSPEVKTTIEQFLAKFNEHDAAGAGEFFSDDQGFYWIEDGRVVYETKTAAITGLTNFIAGFGESRLEAYDVKVTMLDDEAAVASFKFTQTIAANGQASIRVDGMMTMGLTQKDGSWKIAGAHKSANGAAH